MTDTTMRALEQRGYGGVEQMQLLHRAVPTPGRDQVLVRVHAVSPDSGTIHLLRGSPTLVRAALGWKRPRQPVMGLAFAGEVVAVGALDGDTPFTVGDRVAGSAPAAFADFVAAPIARLARVPDTVSFADASTLPVSAGTAVQAIRDAARVQRGQRVLIIGAGGGVGSFLVQLAVDAGATVTGIASAAKAEFVRSLGAEHVIDYREQSDPEQWGRFDVIIDTADGRPLRVLRRALTERGTLVIVGADHVGGPLLEGSDRQLRAMLVNPWVRHRVVPVMQRESGEEVAGLLALLASGRLRAPVEEVVPVEHAERSIQRLIDRTVHGKTVISFADDTP